MEFSRPRETLGVTEPFLGTPGSNEVSISDLMIFFTCSFLVSAALLSGLEASLEAV